MRLILLSFAALLFHSFFSLCASMPLSADAQSPLGITVDSLQDGPSLAETLEQTDAMQEYELDYNDTVNWLDQWTRTHLTQKLQEKNSNYVELLIDSFTPLFPELHGARLNFRCTLLDPCKADNKPSDKSRDQLHAWHVMVALQNINTFYSLQYRLLIDAGNEFMTQYADAFYNRLKQDGLEDKYGASLPTVWNTARAFNGLAKDVLVETWKSIYKVTRFFPAVDITMNIISLIGGPEVKEPPSIPGADLKVAFGDVLKKTREMQEATFDMAMKSDPWSETGIIHRLNVEKDIWFYRSSTQQSSVESRKKTMVKGLGIGFVTTFLSRRGAYLFSINDRYFNQDDYCGGGAKLGLAYPKCYNRLLASDFRMLFFPRSKATSSKDGYRYLETDTAKTLADPLFSQSPFNFGYNELTAGALQCVEWRKNNVDHFQQSNTRLNDAITAHVTKGQNRKVPKGLGDWGYRAMKLQFEQMKTFATEDKTSWKLRLYESSLDPSDPCAWNIPVVGDFKYWPSWPKSVYGVGGMWMMEKYIDAFKQ